MSWRTIRHFCGSHPAPQSRQHRDKDAFYGTDLGFGIIELLEMTKQFDEVSFAADPKFNLTTTCQDSVATIVPRPASQRKDGVQTHVLRLVPYQIVLEVAEGYADRAWERLDALEAVCTNALLDKQNRGYGGFCMPWMSELQRDEFNSSRLPGRRRVLVGQFAYTVNLRVGVSED